MEINRKPDSKTDLSIKSMQVRNQEKRSIAVAATTHDSTLEECVDSFHFVLSLFLVVSYLFLVAYSIQNSQVSEC